MWVVSPTALRDQLPSLLAERSERLDREAPVEVVQEIGSLLPVLAPAGTRYAL